MRTAKIIMLVALTIFIQSCGKNNWFKESNHYPETQIEAGKVYVSMYPPILWYDVVDDLKPNFTVTNASAFIGEVLAITSSDQQINQNRQSFGFNLNLPTTISSNSNNSTSTDTTNDSGTSTIGTQESIFNTTRSSGEIPELTNTAPSSNLLAPNPSIGTNSFASDPFLKYRAATALYQEVQLLNRYLDANVAKNGTIPYLFRTQISVQPSMRQSSLDVYTDIIIENNGSETCDITPEVIPMIVIDNLERSSAQKLYNAVNQLKLSISGTVAGAGLGVGSDSINEQLKNLQALDLNSITTVAKTDKNKLTVRIGAARSSSGFSTIARSYDVTFLVLWPYKNCEKSTIGDLLQITHFKRTDNGKRIPLINQKYKENFIRKIIEISQSRGKTKDKANQIAQDILNNANSNNYLTILDRYCLGEDIELYDIVSKYVSITNFSRDSFSIDIPRYKAPPYQVTIMKDSGKGNATVTIAGVKDFGIAERIDADIIFKNSKTVPIDKSKETIWETNKEMNTRSYSKDIETTSTHLFKAENSIITASSITINKNGLLTATFRSPTAIGLIKLFQEKRAYLALYRKTYPHEEGYGEKKYYSVSYDGVYPVVLNENIGNPTPVLHEALINPSSPSVKKDGETVFKLIITPVKCPEYSVCPKIDSYRVSLSDSTLLKTVTSNNAPVNVDANFNFFKTNLDKTVGNVTKQESKSFEIKLKSIASKTKFNIKINAMNGKKIVAKQEFTIKDITTH